MKTVADVLSTTISSGTQILLAQNKVNVALPTRQQAHYDTVAIIGFSGEGFGGSLGFAAESGVVKAAFGESDTALSDSWVGEIANQLLGRLKNALLTYGLSFQIAIPMVLHGLELSVRVGDGRITQFRFNTPQGQVCVWVDATWDVGRAIEPVDAAHHSRPEGDVLMF